MAIDVRKARRFLYHLGTAQRKLGEREISRKHMETQIRKVKRATRSEPDKLAELKELEQKISEALEKERRVVRHEYDEHAFHVQLLRRIEELSHKLDSFLHVSKSKSERFREVEEKITRSVSLGGDVELLKERIAKLKTMYAQLKKKKVDKKRLESIKKRIDSLIEKLP